MMTRQDARRLFANHALAGMTALESATERMGLDTRGMDPELLARDARRYADAMLMAQGERSTDQRDRTAAIMLAGAIASTRDGKPTKAEAAIYAFRAADALELELLEHPDSPELVDP